MEDSTARIFDALGDPTRRAIVEELCSGQRAVGELATALSAGRPNVSKHLRVLSEAGLVAREERGTRHLYALAEPAFAEAQQWLVAQWDTALARFAEAVEHAAELPDDREAPGGGAA